jgi:HSP20 family protein
MGVPDVEDENKEEKDRIEIDFSKGKISLEGLFRGLGGLLDMVDRFGTVDKKGEIEGPRGIRGVYGFTVKTMAGRPVIETFGNKRSPSSAGSVAEEVREPIVDVFDEEEQLVVISEMPGVEEGDISVEVIGDVLRIVAANKARQYSKEVLLPSRAEVDPVGRSYRNGILEVRLNKEKRE